MFFRFLFMKSESELEASRPNQLELSTTIILDQKKETSSRIGETPLSGNASIRISYYVYA